eukprot:gene16102-18386_t
MRYIDSWLTGLGLEYIIPKLKANGITTPKKLAQLTLRDMYEVVGVEDTEDRKKLYFLIQRLHTILKTRPDQAGGGEGNEGNEGNEDDENSDPAPPPDSPTQRKNIRVTPAINEEMTRSTGTDKSEEDLRVLRKNRRTSMDNSQLSIQSKQRTEVTPDSPRELLDSAALKKNIAARRSSHIPTKDLSRSNSADFNPSPTASTTSAAAPAAPQRGPVAVPTAGLRRLSLNPPAKESASSGYANRPSPTSATNNTDANRSKLAARPSATDAAKAQQDKQLLLQQKQRQLAEEEEALLKLQRINSDGKIKSIRTTNPPARAASTPSPPASPPRMPPPSLQQASNKPRGAIAEPSAGRRANPPAQGQNQDRRSPPPPYETSIATTESSRPPSAPVSSRSDRASYPPVAPRPEVSPSMRSDYGQDADVDDNYTDTDSYEYNHSSDYNESDYDSNHNASYHNNQAEDTHDAPIVDMAIRVVVRKRPISKRELGQGDRDVMEVGRRGQVLIHEPKTKVDLTKIIETQEFRFDDAFEAHETNEVIYSRTIKHLVSFVFDGGKASCFAYGQTGSGKTFSMMGSRPDAPAEAKVNAGLYVLAARDIFTMVQEPQFRRLRVFVSCFEIYSGKLFDLLNERGIVKCLEDAKQQVQLPGLTEHLVNNVNELLDLMAMAHTQRSTGTTGANAESSRSHQVMQILLREPEPVAQANNRMRGRGNIQIVAPEKAGNQGEVCGKLSFIDLAGSERGADTTHNSKQTRMEGAEINTSLLALKEVIRSLERKHGHTPFRGSKLTQVLKDSFVGEKTRTCMVACVSPSHSNCEHTLNTLRYADRVKEHQSSASGAPTGGSSHVSGSGYDSMAYDSNPRPQTANAGGSNHSAKASANDNNAAKSRPTTAAAGSRPTTSAGSAQNTSVNNGAQSERPPSAPRQGINAPSAAGGVPKPLSRLPISSNPNGNARSASVNNAAAQQRKESPQVPASPGRAHNTSSTSGSANNNNNVKKGIPIRQASAPRGTVLSPPSAQGNSSRDNSRDPYPSHHPSQLPSPSARARQPASPSAHNNNSRATPPSSHKRSPPVNSPSPAPSGAASRRGQDKNTTDSDREWPDEPVP